MKFKVPMKTQTVQIYARVPKPLKDRLDKTVDKLKRDKPQYKWNMTLAMQAALEAFIELVDEKKS